MQKDVNLVDLIKSFPTNILLQNLASIQNRTSLVKFAHLADKSGKGSISNLSTKACRPEGSEATEGAELAPAALRPAWKPKVATDTLVRRGLMMTPTGAARSLMRGCGVDSVACELSSHRTCI